jgi:hypothetical protein
MSATLRYNPSHTAFEVTAGSLSWTEEINDSDESMMLHHSGGCYVVVLEGADLEGLQQNSVYQLVKVGTILKPAGEIKDEDGNVLG